MQLNRFDLNLLIALDALLHEKNVTRAAERVFVSQPAMSAALQKLREFFDDQLLVRVGRDMQLTPRGLSLVGPVREALLQIQATLGTQPTFDPRTVQRTFTLIVSADALMRVMPTVLQRLSREAPGIRCHIEHFSETTLSRLEYGDADLFIGLNSLRLFGLREFPESLRIVDLRPVRWLCAVAKDHATVGDTITEEQYLALPHVFGWPSGHTDPPRGAGSPTAERGSRRPRHHSGSARDSIHARGHPTGSDPARRPRAHAGEARAHQVAACAV